jgi:hypothetical protein
MRILGRALSAVILGLGAGAVSARAAALPELPVSAVPSAPAFSIAAPFSASLASPLAAPMYLPSAAPALESAWIPAAAAASNFRKSASGSASAGRPASNGAADAGAPLFKPDLWASLKAPDASELDTLAERIPRLKRDAVRELSFDDADPILQRAADVKMSVLDVFTDAGLRKSGQLFYLSQDTLEKVAAKYKLYILNPFWGKAKDGQRYACLGIVMGAGKIEMIYDQDGFEFDNPDFKDHSYKGSARITETIQGPGDVKVEGLSVAMFMHPRIERFVKLSDDTLRVETNWANEERPLRPIVVRRSARP